MSVTVLVPLDIDIFKYWKYTEIEKAWALESENCVI